MKLADPKQAACAVLMIRPARFRFNVETAPTNAFQRRPEALTTSEVQDRAFGEFEGLAATLRERGVDVIVMQDTPEPVKPDAIFPNNWVSFHRNGCVVLYPMMAENRRAEVRPGIIEALRDAHGFIVRKVVDLTDPVGTGGFLEGTGSLVLDRVHRYAFASRSARTVDRAVARFATELDYDCFLFDAADENEASIYHTNVLMTLGDRFAIVCLDAIVDDSERAAVVRRLESTGHEIVSISLGQMRRFAGNLLQLRNRSDESLLVASEQAVDSLAPSQVRALESFADLVVAPLYTIERFGGGSARCMLAEIFLPHAATGA